MLTIVRSPVPCVPRADGPEAIGEWIARLAEHPQRCVWVVPTARRQRALLREWPANAPHSATLLPDLQTLDGLAAKTLAFSARSRPLVGEVERRLRVARAWQEAVGRAAGSGRV